MPHLNTDDSGAMTLSPTDRMLRRITALDIIWSLAFLIPYGVIVGRNVAPPLLLIPMGFSSIFALYTLSGKARQRWLNASIDTFIATYLLAMVIAANVTITQRYHYRGNVAVLGIHGTTPGMINWFVNMPGFSKHPMDHIDNRVVQYTSTSPGAKWTLQIFSGFCSGACSSHPLVHTAAVKCSIIGACQAPARPAHHQARRGVLLSAR